MRGAVGLREDLVTPEVEEWLDSVLTLKTRPYKGDPETVHGYVRHKGYLWIPRHFNERQIWKRVEEWGWVVPDRDTPFRSLMTLDPKRKQPQAVSAMVDYLRRNYSGILVMPTGMGKTLTSLAISSAFGTPVGIFVYADHMPKNWIDHAQRHLGLREDEIGVIQRDRADVGKPLTLISVQSALHGDYSRQVYDQFGFLIGDEVHRYGAARWQYVVSKFSAKYRLGISADPHRGDGLDPLIGWCWGNVAFTVRKRETGEKAQICMIRLPITYPEKSYCQVYRDRDTGQLMVGDPEPTKYDKKLTKDRARNKWLVDRMIEARQTGRRILIFARHKKHLQALCDEFNARWEGTRETLAMMLVGGATNKRKRALQQQALTESDLAFTTYAFARDAMNEPRFDTLIFATPPGNPLQPVGRLRDKGPADRRPLLVLHPYESDDWSLERAGRCSGLYESLGHPIKWIQKETLS